MQIFSISNKKIGFLTFINLLHYKVYFHLKIHCRLIKSFYLNFFELFKLQIFSLCSLHQTFVLDVINYEVKKRGINILLCGSLLNFVSIVFHPWLLVPNKDKYLVITTYNVLKMDDFFVDGVWFSLFNFIGQDHSS